ncbi:MAG: hypothetical protein AMXMBFR53_30450 [Gemmatimonadota bacterium]
MLRIWIDIGFIRYPLALSFLVVTALAVWMAARLYQPGARADLRTRTWVDAILFWGGFAMVAGVLGTLVGIVIAAQSIEAAGAIHPGLIWGGIRVALESTVVGTLILVWAALLWFTLQLRWRLIEARELQAA